QNPRCIGIIGARRFTAKLYRFFGGKPLFQAGDTAGFSESARGEVLHGYAHPIELAHIELNSLGAEKLLMGQRADNIAHRESVGFGLALKIIAKNNASRAWHILNHGYRVSWNVSADMTANGPAVKIKTASSSIANNDPKCFSFVKLLSVRASRNRCEKKQPIHKTQQKANLCIHASGLSWLDSYSVQSENLFLTYSCCQKVDDFLNGVIRSAIRGL